MSGAGEPLACWLPASMLNDDGVTTRCWPRIMAQKLVPCDRIDAHDAHDWDSESRWRCPGWAHA